MTPDSTFHVGRRPLTRPPEMDGMQRIAVRGGHLQVHVLDLTPPWVANAPTVIFHHGIGIDMDIWSGWLPYLADAFRLVRFDMRGFGGSSLPADARWTVDDFSDDLLAVADATGTDRFHVVAESFGGMVSLNAAIRRPDRVASATLLSTPHCGAAIAPLAGWPELARSEAGMRQWSDGMMEARFAPGSVAPAAHAWFRRVQERTSANWLGTLAQVIGRTDLGASLKGLAVPVLLISGDDSPYVGVGQVAALKALLPDARVNILPGVRHGIAFSHAEESARAFCDFVKPASREETVQPTETS
jgi:3-oxoadipate enol-lactonase